MNFPFSLDIIKYKSIDGECHIPFKNKTTIIIGQNNTGKSNILRGVAEVFNKKYNDDRLNNKYKINIPSSYFHEIFLRLNNMRMYIQGLKTDFSVIIDSGKITPQDAPYELQAYARSHGFLDDFGRSSSNVEDNISAIYNHMFSSVTEHLQGSIYVPNIRYITVSGTEPQNFSKSLIAGKSIEYGGIINSLSALNRPTTQARVDARQKFAKIEDFLAFCLDRKKVKIEIPHDHSTIHIDIDGEEHPLQDLGTGIEQLLIIGLSSFNFPGKVVLVDEPELHFHPRAQKRMIQYLHDNVESHFVFATHSAAILDAVEADILQVTHDGKKSLVNTISNNKDRYQAVRDLGHSPSDLLLTRYVIWVEGPSDRIYLNHWLKKADPSLKEGIDYTIVFYGGKILSHHSFDEVESELVKAFSLCREFALLMDSDIHEKRSVINATKQRIKDEVEKENGFCWITDGREVENYLPVSIIASLKDSFDAHMPSSKNEQVVTENKTNFAKTAIKLLEELPKDDYVWPLDLEEQISELVKRIVAAK